MEIGRTESVKGWSRIAAAAGVLLAAIVGLMALAGSASAEILRTEALPNGVQRTTYRYGPVNVTSGQNRIAFRVLSGSSRPAVDGWITRIKPDLVYEDGSVPDSSKVMFHHGVWINQSTNEQFYATGEEKTILKLPQGFGYKYDPDDIWVLNDMIHNLTPNAMQLYFEYTLDFIPASAPEAANIVRARPIWMDVENGSIYPVFDVWRDSGGADGKFTFPQDATNPYPSGNQKNVKTIPANGVLLATTGHVHTGGLSTELYLRRDGATYQGPSCPDRISYDDQLKPLKAKQAKLVAKINRIKKRNTKLSRNQKKISKSLRSKHSKAKAKRQVKQIKRKKKANSKLIAKVNRLKAANKKQLDKVKAKDKAERERDAACRATQPKVDDGNRVNLFNSVAHYFDPRGPISWDMSMYSTDENWRVRVKTGDKLELQTTYETKLASWPESMGINIVYWARDSAINAVAGNSDPAAAPDPYVTNVSQKGELNHEHYKENEDYGGETGKNGSKLVGPDPTKLPDGPETGGPFTISDFSYGQGDFRLPGEFGRPPVVKQGQSFTFKLSDSDVTNEVWHSITSCATPCNKSTGISYPIPNGKVQFESGQMGPGKAPTVGYTQWSTPNNLPKGTYTFYCRIHPLMRGAFRVE
jgi:hypothetical protein